MYYHFVARTYRNATPFNDPKKAYWAWRILKAAFPDALAVTLMPNHIHLVLKSDSPKQDRTKLAHILGRFTFVFDEKTPFWQPVPEPHPIVSQEKLRRDIRYVLLNPCRAKLCNDPLAWKWSTYRGSIGAAMNPWVSPKRLLQALGGTSIQNHRYLSSDPSVSVQGTSLPTAVLPSKTPQKNLQDIAAAVFSAAEEPHDPQLFQIKKSVVRVLFVRLAYHQGWQDAATLAQFMQISYSTTWKLVQREKNKDCSAAALCLGDERLRKSVRPHLEENLPFE